MRCDIIELISLCNIWCHWWVGTHWITWLSSFVLNILWDSVCFVYQKIRRDILKPFNKIVWRIQPFMKKQWLVFRHGPFQCNPEIRCQNPQWKSPEVPRPEKCKYKNSRLKTCWSTFQYPRNCTLQICSSETNGQLTILSSLCLRIQPFRQSEHCSPPPKEKTKRNTSTEIFIPIRYDPCDFSCFQNQKSHEGVSFCIIWRHSEQWNNGITAQKGLLKNSEQNNFEGSYTH